MSHVGVHLPCACCATRCSLTSSFPAAVAPAGTWEAPTIPNPEYKGEWKPKQINNPAYKGVWVAPDIDNPEYKHDDKLYNYKDLKYVGFELWQVKAGTIFDNIFVGTSFEEAEAFANETWAKNKDGEKEMHDKVGPGSSAIPLSALAP